MARIFDFLERCKQFAKDVFALLQRVPMRGQNIRLSDQLYRCAPSVGANYNEAADSLGKAGPTHETSNVSPRGR